MALLEVEPVDAPPTLEGVNSESAEPELEGAGDRVNLAEANPQEDLPPEPKA